MRIGHVVQSGILVENRRLVVKSPTFLLQRGDDVIVLFALVLVEIGGRNRIESGIDVADAGERKGGGLVWIVGNLELSLIRAQHQGDPRVIIQQLRHVAETLPLLGAVMNRVPGGRGVFDALLTGQVVPGEVIVERAAAAHEFDARLDQAVTASQDADAAAGRGVDAILGLNLDDTGRAHTELGGNGTGDKVDTVDEAAVDGLPKAADSLRQRHAVDAKLDVGMVVTNVDRTRSLGILRNARQREQDFVHRRIRPFAVFVDALLIDRVDRRSHLRRQRDLSVLEPRRRDCDSRNPRRFGDDECHIGRRICFNLHNLARGRCRRRAADDGVATRRNVGEPGNAAAVRRLFRDFLSGCVLQRNHDSGQEFSRSVFGGCADR